MKLLLGLFLLLMPSLAISEKLPEGTKSESFNTFFGGNNTRNVPWKLREAQSPNSANVLFDENPGRTTAVNGYEILGATNTLTSIEAIWEFKKDNGASEFLATDNATLLSTLDFTNFTTVRSGLDNAFALQCKQIRDKMWCTNGTNPVFTYNGSTVVVLNGLLHGSTQTPNVPLGKLIDTYLDRVFVFNSTQNASALHWSEIKSTDSIIILPDDHRAWPVTNQLNFSPGDGSVGLAMFVYNGKLYTGKTDKIGLLQGDRTDNFFFQPYPVESGPMSNKSVKVLDNVVYYQGTEGIFAFDGVKAIRVSDDIRDDIKQTLQTLSFTRQNIWTTNDDLDAGAKGGVYATNGSLVLSTFSISQYATVAEDTRFLLTSTAPDSGWIKFSTPSYKRFTGNLPGLGAGSHLQSTNTLDFSGYMSSAFILYNSTSLCNYPGGVEVSKLNFYLRNTNDNESKHQSMHNVVLWGPSVNVFTDLIFPGDYLNALTAPIMFSSNTLHVTKSDLDSQRIEYRFVWSTAGIANPCQLQITNLSTPTTVSQAVTVQMRVTTAAYESFIATNSATIIAWDTFLSNYNTTNANIQFRYRNGTSVANIITQPWQTITPGALLSAAVSKSFVQWGATITATQSNQVVAQIDDVTIKNIGVGGISHSSWAEVRKNRYWLFTSTETNSTTMRGFVKASASNENPIAWSFLNNFPIRAMYNNRETFYAGSSTAGVLVRLDAGSSLNGSPISKYWETPDTNLGNPFFKKKLRSYYIEVVGTSGDTLTIGTYVDGSYSSTTQTLYTTGRNLIKYATPASFYGLLFRWRIENTSLNQDLGIVSFRVVYEDTQIDRYE